MMQSSGSRSPSIPAVLGGNRMLPKYRELPESALGGARHAWDVFGKGDDLGRLNLLTAQNILAAAREVRKGDVFNLCLPLDLPDPPWGRERKPYVHHIYDPDRNTKDDYLDSFFLQRSTQWDGLRHIRAATLGFYGGTNVDNVGFEGLELGIQAWAELGIVGRGVLVDVARYLAENGNPLDPHIGTPISVTDLENA